ncbi:hypothetical protein RRG08_042938 [Elysia crispata]|uniref:Uncharacterized protein n=1 Tax=Elysia crispata TaxID=231223 RepID=A0AAE1AU79_9GAST|nr:hypothetical protein RRG08_042938 [Elysia crispata]
MAQTVSLILITKCEIKTRFLEYDQLDMSELSSAMAISQVIFIGHFQAGTRVDPPWADGVLGDVRAWQS